MYFTVNKSTCDFDFNFSGDSGTSGGRTFAGFASFFGSRNVPLCPQCPQCPAFPVIPPCPAPSAPASCPPPPSQQGETTISLTPEPMGKSLVIHVVRRFQLLFFKTKIVFQFVHVEFDVSFFTKSLFGLYV